MAARHGVFLNGYLKLIGASYDRPGNSPSQRNPPREPEDVDRLPLGVRWALRWLDGSKLDLDSGSDLHKAPLISTGILSDILSFFEVF